MGGQNRNQPASSKIVSTVSGITIQSTGKLLNRMKVHLHFVERIAAGPLPTVLSEAGWQLRKEGSLENIRSDVLRDSSHCRKEM